ncbi:hypothetical protein KUCAC02_015903, partial [Chaenocephalus aceratus]
SSDGEAEEEDVDVALKKEVAQLKASGAKRERRFMALDSGANNVIFIKTQNIEADKLVHLVLSDLHTTKKHKSRVILRMLPVTGTCKAFQEDMVKYLATFLEPWFQNPNCGTYQIAFKARNSSHNKRDEIIKTIAGMVGKLNPKNKVDLTNPELTIVVEVIKAVCCLSVVLLKKVSDEFDCGVVFEEVRDDDAILPIFEEKIIGKVEKLETRGQRILLEEPAKQNRKPAFPLKLDDHTKELVWRSLINNTELKLYQLPQERDDVVLFDREEKTSLKNVRSESLAPLLNLQEALEQYGRKLVVVACQTLRFRTLIGPESDPDLKLNDDSYCVLERESFKKDLHGSSFKIDARKLHYMRKALVKHGLVSMQSHVTRVISGQQQHSILLLLKRFYVNRRAKYDILMEYICNLLQQSPECGGQHFQRVFQYMRNAKLAEFCQYPLEDLDPSAGPCINKKAGRIGSNPPEGRIMERDVLSQAYNMVLSTGTKGVAQRGISCKVNVGKLESRMICRRLEREDMIKGFMVDQGRQRTTQFISHRFVGVSNRLQRFAKEQERTKLLYSSAPQALDVDAPSPKSPPTAKRKKASSKSPAAKKFRKADGGGKETVEEDGEVNTEVRALDGEGGEAAGEKSQVKAEHPESPFIQAAEGETAACSESNSSAAPDSESTPTAEPAGVEEDDPNSNPFSTFLRGAVERSQQLGRQRRCCCYRFLQETGGENLIVEAVRNFKIIEGLFPLQKIITDDEKKDGINTRCCKKTIVRTVDSLSREGLLKVYKTTIIQDGVTKNVEMVVHPSVQPTDEIVTRLIEQIRFRISIISSTPKRKPEREGAAPEDTSGSPSRANKRDKKKNKTDEFKPTTVKGLGKSLGFQPKMHRMRVVHNFLWYLIYGHLSKQSSSDSQRPATHVISSGDEEEEQKDTSIPSDSQSDLKGVCRGWAMVGDILLCMPLSVFIQVIQVNYKVEGLEEYLNDPVKQHHLIRTLPARMRRQLLYKRKYIFAFHENLQKLVYMGLVQFGHVEKFKEKDQTSPPCVHDSRGGHVMRNASIVDTTNAEPHELARHRVLRQTLRAAPRHVQQRRGRGERRFDLMGVIRIKRNPSEEETDPSFVHERNVFVGLAYLLKGNLEVCDDGSIPGDGKGAGGLHSEFFAHLKRNWLWTNHLLAVRTTPSGCEAKENKIRLKSLLSKNSLRIALKASGTINPRYSTAKRSVIAETIEVDIEPASRNQQVVGGKKQKRKRTKKEVAKPPRKKKKEPKKRLPAHDEADHRALKMMTRQRVYWSDKPLMSLLEENKPADPSIVEDCAKSFLEYARLLRQKFSSVVLNAREMIMPDTKRQLFSRTLAMTNNQMKASRSFQTFHMYSKYNQEMLCQAFIQCRKRGLVNRRRINQAFGPKKNRALPILPMSYQLSQSYYRYTAAQRSTRSIYDCFSWRFPNSLCTDSFRFLRSLINNGMSDDQPVTAFYNEPENRSESEDVVTERRAASEKKKKTKQKGERRTSEGTREGTREGTGEGNQ